MLKSQVFKIKKFTKRGWNFKGKVFGCGKEMSINLMEKKKEQHAGGQFTAQSTKNHTVGLVQL